MSDHLANVTVCITAHPVGEPPSSRMPSSTGRLGPSSELESYLDIKKVISIPFLGFQFELTFGINNKFICYRVFDQESILKFFGIDFSCFEFNNYLKQQQIEIKNITSNFLYKLICKSVNTYLNNNQENKITELTNNISNLNIFNEFINFIINININNINSLNTFEQYRSMFIQKLNDLSILPENIISEFKFILNISIRQYVQNLLENNRTIEDFWKPINIHISNEDFEKNIIHTRMSKKLQIKLLCDNTCTICLETIRPNQITTILGCRHVFHKKCAKEWFTQKCNKPVCPSCRSDIRKNKSFNSKLF